MRFSLMSPHYADSIRTSSPDLLSLSQLGTFAKTYEGQEPGTAVRGSCIRRIMVRGPGSHWMRRAMRLNTRCVQSGDTAPHGFP